MVSPVSSSDPVNNLQSQPKGSRCSNTVSKIKEFTRTLFLSVIPMIVLTVAACWTNPSISGVCIIMGYLMADDAKRMADKISLLFKHAMVPLILLGGIYYLSNLPVFIAMGSALWSAHLGSILYQKVAAKEAAEAAKLATPAKV
jgi:hypothetical protein